jgi:hypothetical protein
MTATTETPQLPEVYFVAEDAYGDVYLWSGKEGDADCQPLVARRTLDAEHTDLWPALLRGLSVKVAA